jgi:hypothetical protein
MAVRTAAKKEARHNHTLRPRSRPTYTVSAHGDLNLTSKLAKLGLQIGGPGRVGGAVGPQNRRPHHGQQRQRRHGAGWAGGRAGRAGRAGGGGGGPAVLFTAAQAGVAVVVAGVVVVSVTDVLRTVSKGCIVLRA